MQRLTLAAVGFALMSGAWAAWRQGWTYDEYYHLKWSERLVFRGESERVSNERWNSKTPVMIPGALARRAAGALGIHEPRALRFAARLPTLGWLAALLGVTFWFTRRHVGPLAARVATIGVALDPSLVAHGSLATVDVAYAAAVVFTLASVALFAERPGWRTGVSLGLALGLAFVAKFSAVVLLPGLPFVLVGRSWPRGTRARALAALALAAATAWVALCGAYLFRDVGVPLGGRRWQSAAFLALSEQAPGLRAPVPLAFLTGIDLSLAHERAKTFPVYLLGRQHPGGVWYYFGVLWLLKTPLLALAAQGAGLMLAVRRGLPWASPPLRFTAVNLAWQLAYFSLLFRAQLGYRFALMCVPLAWIVAAGGLASLAPRRALRFAGAVVVASAVLENVWYLGNPLSFANAAVWPRSAAFRLMADSNLDWGQNRDKIDGWMTRHGIEPARLDPPLALPGTNLLSVNVLTGVKGSFERHRWLRENLSPVRHLGHTYLWFELGPAEYERFVAETGVRRAPPPAAGRSGARDPLLY
jgi:4-amino-4-deoxy-L-arabinose transferase-like glycosyltransferase